ncbi:uncharacterized protein LOC132190120 [Corylus avellana]|uniref:uncharacterized protein LOC132190120 n=1 Tax=Corylus avellana TaxID=13451 RepID=UPI00286BCAB5|nr:uncharacterized protein LOC132190120 [Corylus avellana]
MAYPHYRSQFGDTTFTKVFVGGLAWETPTEEMRRYFEQFGEILEAVIITDKSTGKSKGYGFVTFRDPESARRACAEPNPVIDGRRANCNIASFGRPRPSPPRGRNQGGSSYQGGAPSYSGVVAPSPAPPPPPPPPPVIYPPYGYPTYSPDYGYHQALYNPQVQQPQYYQHLYGTSSSSMGMGSPYYYGYSYQAPRGSFSSVPQGQRLPGSSYIYYPMQMDSSLSTTFPTRHPFPSSTDSQMAAQRISSTTEAGVVSSESPNT